MHRDTHGITRQAVHIIIYHSMSTSSSTYEDTKIQFGELSDYSSLTCHLCSFAMYFVGAVLNLLFLPVIPGYIAAMDRVGAVVIER